MLTHIEIYNRWLKVYVEKYDEVCIIHPQTNKPVWIQIKSAQRYIYSYN